jgi:hypothetical protein
MDINKIGIIDLTVFLYKLLAAAIMVSITISVPLFLLLHH